MIYRIIPLSLFLLISFIGFSQTPTISRMLPGNPTLNPSSFVCDPGESAFAGTSTQALVTPSLSNNVAFLCFGDSLRVDHLGGQTFSDPNSSTDPGISYSIYRCPPTIDGPDFNSVKADPCNFTDPDPGANSLFLVGFDLGLNTDNSGDATLFNNGSLQTFFKNDSAVQLWFAPITMDNLAQFGFEEESPGGENGPCINANVSDAFSVVFLNELRIEDVNNNAGGNGCTASMTLKGGISEWDDSKYTIEAFNIADPSIEGDIISTFSHDDTFVFNIPVPGTYRVIVTDDLCGMTSVDVDMIGCTEVVINVPDVFGSPGSNVCLDITAQDFTDVFSMQFSMEWDATILSYTGINGVEIMEPVLNFGPPNPNNFLVVFAAITNPAPTPISVGDGLPLFQICFDIIAPLGSMSPVEITGNFQSIEFTHNGIGNSEIAYIINQGSVTVSNVNLDLTSCSTPSTLSTGDFTIIANGGDEPYTYAWEQVGTLTNNGSGTIPFAGAPGELVTPLPPGNYSVTITDNGNVSQTGTIEIISGDQLLPQINRTDPSCATSTDGAVTAVPLGGVTPFTYLWSTMQTGPTITGLPQGTYSVTVTDAMGCQRSDSENIGVSAVVLDTVSLVHVTCGGGGSDGAITVVASGGTVAPGSDYIYEWDTGDTGPSIFGLAPGTYCVSVRDDNNCPDAMCLDVNAPILPMIISFDSTSVQCPNQNNGGLVVHAVPGNVPISNYQWDPNPNGSTDSILMNIPSGNYSVTVTADDGCSAVASASLFAPEPIRLDSIIETRPTCPGDTDGTIQLFIAGGTQPYNILWSDGSLFPVLPALACDQTYSVTISDANDCDVIMEDIFLECPTAIGVVFDQLMDVSCADGTNCDGGAIANAFGGTAGTGLYTYRWSSGEEQFDVDDGVATQLCLGMNFVTITDGNCGYIDTVEISSPPPLSIVVDQNALTPVSCFGRNDGAVTITAIGGTPGYEYQWVNPMVTGPTLSGVSAGTYTVFITDINDCTNSISTVVNQPDLFEVLVDSMQVRSIGCSGDSTGVIPVVTTGGNLGTVTYEWTNNISDSLSAVGLAAGTYSITATDPKGCTDEVLYTFVEPDPIVFDLSDIVEPECFGFQTVITIDTAFGGNGVPFEFSVDGGPKRPINAAIPILGGADHDITVFDSEGCPSMVENTFVGQPAEVLVDLGDDLEIQLGDSIEIESFIGSLLPLDSVVWEPFTGFDCSDPSCLDIWVKPQEETDYELTVYDINGCSGTDQIVVDVDKNRNVFIPNVFTPNGDGTNDIFIPFIGPGVLQINSMQIYDRWGEVLYDNKNFIPNNDFVEEGWDGKLNGKVMNSGVYVYLIEVAFVDGLVLLYRGDITVLN